MGNGLDRINRRILHLSRTVLRHDYEYELKSDTRVINGRYILSIA